jgi:hypothetical protein
MIMPFAQECEHLSGMLQGQAAKLSRLLDQQQIQSSGMDKAAKLKLDLPYRRLVFNAQQHAALLQACGRVEGEDMGDGLCFLSQPAAEILKVLKQGHRLSISLLDAFFEHDIDILGAVGRSGGSLKVGVRRLSIDD